MYRRWRTLASSSTTSQTSSPPRPVPGHAPSRRTYAAIRSRQPWRFARRATASCARATPCRPWRPFTSTVATLKLSSSANPTSRSTTSGLVCSMNAGSATAAATTIKSGTALSIAANASRTSRLSSTTASGQPAMRADPFTKLIRRLAAVESPFSSASRQTYFAATSFSVSVNVIGVPGDTTTSR